jgi:hypothetical protein
LIVIEKKTKEKLVIKAKGYEVLAVVWGYA